MEQQAGGNLQPGQLAELMERLKGKAKEKDWREWYSASGGGKVYQQLEKQAAAEGAPLRVEGTHSPREVFHYGDEKAYRIKHREADGTMGIYVNIRDLQRKWFRQGLEAAGQTIDKLHLIDMSVTEGLGGVDRTAAATFLPSNIAKAIGAGPDRVADVRKALAEAVEPLIQPHFRIVFGDGGGDLENNYRLAPADREVKLSCVEVKDPYVSTMKAVLNSYDKILPVVKKKVLGGG